jgi:hypothetical protein
MKALFALSFAGLLVACGGQPVQEPVDVVEQEEVPEITLNLPANDCVCEQLQANYTFIEKAFIALEDGEYLEALQYFQRYQRIENSAVADMESRIAIAYLSILPDSPIYDRDAAVQSYRALRGAITPEMDLHGEVRLMRQSLETFLDNYGQIERLKVSNGSLRAELEKREEAIKRLRDLTLGRESEAAGLLGN